MLRHIVHQGGARRYSRAWVRYGELWEEFRRRLYWWGSIKELRKLALILVLVLLQVGPRQLVPCDWVLHRWHTAWGLMAHAIFPEAWAGDLWLQALAVDSAGSTSIVDV